MSDIHVLRASADGDSLRVVFHFPVPDMNNDIGFNIRNVILASGLGGITQLSEGTDAGQIDPVEKAQIEAGVVFEQGLSLSRAILLSGGTTLAEIRNTLRSYYTQMKRDTTAAMRTALQFYGYTTDGA